MFNILVDRLSRVALLLSFPNKFPFLSAPTTFKMFNGILLDRAYLSVIKQQWKKVRLHICGEAKKRAKE